MSRVWIKFAGRSLVALVLGVASTGARAQLNSNTATVTLNATLNETLTVGATPSSVNFALVAGGAATGSSPVAITTTWLLGAGRANVELDAYFQSATAALTTGGGTPVNIPSSEVFGQVTTGTPTNFTAFTGTPALGTAGAGLALLTVPLTSGNRAGTRTDNLNLKIDLTSQPQAPAATYTGTLYIQAQAL